MIAENEEIRRVCVAVEAPLHSGLHGPLDYTCERALPPGALVRVPLGRRDVPGVVWNDTPAEGDDGHALRPVAQVMDALPPLPPRWCDLVRFTALYYQRGLGEVAMSVLPPELRKLDNAGLHSRIARLRKAYDQPLPAAPSASRPDLTPDQADVLARLAAANVPGAAPVVLLHGLTGSG